MHRDDLVAQNLTMGPRGCESAGLNCTMHLLGIPGVCARKPVDGRACIAETNAAAARAAPPGSSAAV